MSATVADVDLANLDTFVTGVPHDMFDRLRSDGFGLEEPLWSPRPGSATQTEVERNRTSHQAVTP